MRRLIGIVILCLGVLLASLGIMTRTVWKPTDYVQVKTAEIKSAVVYLPHNVRDMIDTPVKVKLSSQENAKIFVAGAPSTDVQSWIAGAKVAKISGLQSWKELRVENQGSGNPPALGPLDTWIVSTTGTGKVEISGNDLKAFQNYDLLAASENGAPLQIEIDWKNNSGTPFFLPGLILGIIFAILGILVLIDDRSRRRKAAKRAARAERRRQRLMQLENQTTLIPKVTAADLEKVDEYEDDNSGHPTSVKSNTKRVSLTEQVRKRPPMPRVPHSPDTDKTNLESQDIPGTDVDNSDDAGSKEA